MQPGEDASYSDEEFTQALTTAKAALALIGSFGTPPTPEIFGLWYRYVEGTNELLVKRLAHFVKDTKRIDRHRVEGLLSEFFPSAASSALAQTLSSELSDELASLQTWTQTQLAAGGELSESVSRVSESLTSPQPTAEEVRESVSLILSSTAKMQTRLEQAQIQLAESHAKIAELTASLVETNKALLIDGLTGVGNRRFFDAMMRNVFEQKQSDETYLFLLIIDVDNFKDVNDSFGHEAGDDLLRYLGNEFQRLTDQYSVARLGGDEFAIVIRGSEASYGKDLAQRIVESIANNTPTIVGVEDYLQRITLSIGVALLRPDDNATSWMDRADRLMYSVKESGRNGFMGERKMNAP